MNNRKKGIDKKNVEKQKKNYSCYSACLLSKKKKEILLDFFIIIGSIYAV